MKLEIFKMQDELRNLIDGNGHLMASAEEIHRQESIALDLMKNLLGCAIVKNDKLFILSELELYFGGIGDMAHDWYRRSFPEKYSDGKISRTSKETSKFQAMKGPIYYYNRLGGGKHKRCDIVVSSVMSTDVIHEVHGYGVLIYLSITLMWSKRPSFS